MVVKRITEEIVGAAEDIKEVVKIIKETVYSGRNIYKNGRYGKRIWK